MSEPISWSSVMETLSSIAKDYPGGVPSVSQAANKLHDVADRGNKNGSQIETSSAKVIFYFNPFVSGDLGGDVRNFLADVAVKGLGLTEHQYEIVANLPDKTAHLWIGEEAIESPRLEKRGEQMVILCPPFAKVKDSAPLKRALWGVLKTFVGKGPR